MKKLIIITGLIALFAFASCREDKKIPEPAPKTPPVDNPTPPPSPKTGIPAETPEEDGTSISVKKDGASVETKDGKNKTDISVSKNDASVEIKKSKN
ncbi:hypothetical protein [Flavobacterium microcysteis]|uniref:Uncharacterized protein n=1 Tax=Flavobacterium microcysteis TaxID=2596891 RepID=A0A501QGD9_9FLAO|nr:hypothetical protein [Flavobacterium microcysteis]TPD71167.1 hypothetical protein FJA49_04520 [Flavobacterium microcysteis]